MFKPLEWIRTIVVAVARHDRELAELRRRVTALEQHTINFGPKVRRSDPSIVGCPSWEEPYKPPHV